MRVAGYGSFAAAARAAAAIAHAADDDAADGAHDETNADGGKRQQQTARARGRRKKGTPDVEREKRIGQEVVELERIADDDGHDMANGNGAGRR
ncbi:MAG: hypothetical protein ACREVZ_02285 [Burkholderiales bacterium]